MHHYSLHDMLRLYRVRAKKTLSQNFIFDKSLLRRIAALPAGYQPDAQTLAIEVGPAAGNLSRALLGHGYSRIVLVEKDERFKPILAQLEDFAQGKIRVQFDDALKMDPAWLQDYRGDCDRLMVVGNLPFAVATPLTLGLLRAFDTGSPLVDLFTRDIQMVLMYQLEVAKKLVAKPGSSDYGRLAVMAQTFCNVRMLERVPSTKFTPKPKVDAGLVHFQFKPEMRSAHMFDRLEALTANHFRHKNQIAPELDGRRPLHIAPGEFLLKARHSGACLD